MNFDFIKLLQEKMPELYLAEKEPLAKHTSFQIGGPALMAFPSSCEQLKALWDLCLEHGPKPLVLGAGTNVLAPDEGVDCLVICTRRMVGVRDLGRGRIEGESGLLLTKLAVFARDLGLTGLEFAHGIPGSLGGGVYMNAGAYGGELSQVVEKTVALLPDGSVWEADGAAQDFSYRHSAFMAQDAVVLKAVLRLEPGDKEQISEKMRELAAKRRSSQPLEYPSAGSTFKRPAGHYAGALIEAAGLKGKGVGDAAVSEKHAGFVINKGNATGAEVRAAMELIQKTVYEHSGVQLEPEVRIW